MTTLLKVTEEIEQESASKPVAIEPETLAQHCMWCEGCPICFDTILDAEI